MGPLSARALELINTSDPLNPLFSPNRLTQERFIAIPSRYGFHTNKWRGLLGKYTATLTNMSTADWKGRLGRRGGWGSLDFQDTSSQYASCGDVFKTGTSNFTVLCWVLADSWQDPEGPGLVFKGAQTNANHGFMLRQTSTSSFQFVVGNGTARAAATSAGYSTGKWYRVGGCRLDGNIYLFVNGVQVATAAAVSGSYTSSLSLDIGRGGNSGAGFDYFNGKIDDVTLVMHGYSAAEFYADYRDSCLTYPRTLNRVQPKSFVAVAGGGGGSSTDGFYYYRMMQG